MACLFCNHLHSVEDKLQGAFLIIFMILLRFPDRRKMILKVKTEKMYINEDLYKQSFPTCVQRSMISGSWEAPAAAQVKLQVKQV